MARINYRIPNIPDGSIPWLANECFIELVGKEFHIGKVKAVDIVEMKDLSIESMILLSAVAGALIQHLYDKHANMSNVFEYGKFSIELTEHEEVKS